MQLHDTPEENGDRQAGHNGQSVPPASHESRHSRIELSRGQFALVDDADLFALGQFLWSFQPNGKTGYAIRGVKRAEGGYRSELMHRRIMNATADQMVDHINGNGLDNRRCNLRFVEPRQNASNRKAKGVSYHARTNKWVARIEVGGEKHWLGSFDAQADATAAYTEARARLCGEYAGEVG